MDAFEKVWQEKQDILMNSRDRRIITGTDTVYEIPVVFQVIHTGTAIGTNYNPTLAKLQSIIDYLNQVFGSTYPGYPTTTTGGVNVPLRFVLAKRDPNCNATDGVNRIDAHSVLSGADLTAYLNSGVQVQGSTGITDAMLKGLVQWPSDRYYNIWLVNKIDGCDFYGACGGVDGYAQFAGGTPTTDGTVIVEGSNNVGGTTLAHELGHAFNLYHVFEGGCLNPATNPCATTGDFICDTDPQPEEYNCGVTGNTPCGTPWFPTLNNIMSYGSGCTDRFTPGQAERVRTALLTQRASLIYSLGGTAPGASTTPYPVPVALSGCATPTISMPTSTANIGPSSIRIGDLHYSSEGYTGDSAVYIDRTVASCKFEAAKPANLERGATYPIEIGTGYNAENVRVWIDYNNDGSFSAAELVFSSNGVQGTDHYRIHTGTFTVPATATLTTTNPVRIRVVSDFVSNASPAACGGSLDEGQAEDFSAFISDIVPTAVTIKSISASVATNKKSINLTWEVAAENNILNYEIESSLDARVFSKIGSLDSKGSNSSYLFNDANPTFNQANYYRLKINENDNSSRYSAVVSATINAKINLATDQLRIYPNPVENSINVIVPKTGSYSVSITNELGQVVKTIKSVEMTEGVSTPIDLVANKLASGVYNLVLVNQEGVSVSGKFVKK